MKPVTNPRGLTRGQFLGNLAAALCSAGPRPQSGRPARPNFIFILCDDLGWGDLPCYGHRGLIAHGGWNVRGNLKMPSVDRLAREGTRFTQFYVASAVCSPSRAALMTGQFPARLGIHDYLASTELNRKRGVADHLDPSIPTVTRLLKDSGYATAHFGKWHLGGADSPKPEQYGITRYDACISPPQGRVRSSEKISGEILAFMETHRNQPFFINAWLYDPHSPLHPADEMMAPYKDLPSGWKGQRSAFEVYYGVLEYLDRQVGRILDKLDELGLSENTVVVFSSDNGPESDLIPFTSFYAAASTAGPFRGLKRSLYEGGVRTPFIVRWPGKTPGGKVDNRTVIGGVDFLPTICRLAGVPLPAGVLADGEDLSASILGKPHVRTRPLLWENRFPVYGHVLDMSPMLAVREGNWKLLMNPDRSRVELYDIPADPTEMSNRAREFPDVVKRLSSQLLRWQATLPKGPVEKDAGSNRYPWPQEQ